MPGPKCQRVMIINCEIQTTFYRDVYVCAHACVHVYVHSHDGHHGHRGNLLKYVLLTVV